MSINDWDSLTSLRWWNSCRVCEINSQSSSSPFSKMLSNSNLFDVKSHLYEKLKNYSHPTFSTYHPGQLAAINTKASSSPGKQTENKSPKHMS